MLPHTRVYLLSLRSSSISFLALSSCVRASLSAEVSLVELLALA